MNDLIFATASEIAPLLRDRAVSATEVLNAYLAQIARHNERINAIATLNEESARKRAKEADEALAKGEIWGPLHGIPVAIKDTLATAGLRTTAGYPPLRNYIPTQDATVVARLRDAGAIILAKTNLAEMAGDYQSTNDLFGRVNNPWDVNRTSGGSSGGSAAAIAAGFSPLDLGSDVSGSIRQPAHCCGVFALKPTDRRIPTVGHIPEAPGLPKCIRQLMIIGPLARSVEDLRLCFSLIVGADPQQPDVPPVPLDTPSGKSLENLRIAWMDGWDEIPVHSEIQTAIQNVARQLTGTCDRVEYWSPPNWNLEAAFRACNQLTALNFAYSQPADFRTAGSTFPVAWREATQGDKDLRKLSNFSHFLPTLLNPTLKGYFETLTQRDRFIAQLDAALEPWDVWLCPVATTPAFTHRAKGTPIEVEGRNVPYFLANGAYTMLFNFTGHPTVVIPIGQTSQGLPIGLQVVGKRWRELELLAIAQEIVSAIGGFQPPPGC